MLNQIQIGDCNYRKLVAVVVEREAGFRVLLVPAVQTNCMLSLELYEVHRYTDVLRVELYAGFKQWNRPVNLDVSIYRDLMCAEVTGCGGERLRSRYPYPNKRMYAVNEKLQLNRWLYEWLQYCTEPVVPSTSLLGKLQD